MDLSQWTINYLRRRRGESRDPLFEKGLVCMHLLNTNNFFNFRTQYISRNGDEVILM